MRSFLYTVGLAVVLAYILPLFVQAENFKFLDNDSSGWLIQLDNSGRVWIGLSMQSSMNSSVSGGAIYGYGVVGGNLHTNLAALEFNEVSRITPFARLGMGWEWPTSLNVLPDLQLRTISHEIAAAVREIDGKPRWVIELTPFILTFGFGRRN